jgi:hypothetical protein
MSLPEEKAYIIVEYSDTEIEIQHSHSIAAAKDMFDNLRSTITNKKARATLIGIDYRTGKCSELETMDLPKIHKKGKTNWRLGEGEISNLPDESK